MGARLLTQEVESPGFETHPVGLKQKHAVPYLNVSASLSGKKVFLTVVNQSIDQDVEATLELRGASRPTSAAKFFMRRIREPSIPMTLPRTSLQND